MLTIMTSGVMIVKRFNHDGFKMADREIPVQVKLTEAEKAKLKSLAHQRETSMSGVVRLWIARAKLA